MEITDEQIIEQLEKHNNILLYKVELREYYEKLNKKYNSIYISTPKKGKTAFEQILKKLDKTQQTKNKTISKLLEEIIIKSRQTQLIILLDNFEQLSKRELQNYRELEQQENIIIIANINDEDKEVIDENFMDKFIILNTEYQSNRSQSINMNMTILLLLSFLIFIIFLKIQLSVLRYIISGLWFTLLMYRSFYYISR